MASKPDDQTQDQPVDDQTQEPADDQAQTPADEPTDQIAELTADLKRLQADFANYRRRAEADRADLLALATSRVVREFLAVRDSFDAEAAHRPQDADPAWAKSIDAIRAQFDQILAAQGVIRFESLGQEFDPRRHEAVAHDGDGTTVTAELQPGYELAGQVIRPAIVKVGSAPDQAGKEK